ncbi:MAG TPA: class I SAM-dependent methyltransferase [Polyangiaceae bacterium]|nr:class I SAM-dependent methyltransferase [Polyangiaceae bacterium]
MSKALIALGQRLSRMGYRFTTVTPTAQGIVNRRAANQKARSLVDIFGWNRPFSADVLAPGLLELMQAAEILEAEPGTGSWRSTIRFSTIDEMLFAHSAFPTTKRDAVFFGPDSVRFVSAILRTAAPAARVVDIGCGTGVGGIALRKAGFVQRQLVLADINPEALRLAEVNAVLAGIDADIVGSDVLSGVEGEIDLVVANPPYLRDDQHRLYRDGSGEYGEAIGVRMVREALRRLRENPRGGSLLLYTGAAIVEGADMFLAALVDDLRETEVRFVYHELDPDVFSEELAKPAYANVDRIAAVFLHVQVGRR